MEDWSLSSRMFRNIVQRYGSPDVDLMASNASRKTPFFYSWSREDTEALALDSLSQDINWAGWELPYLFPPFSLIGPCLNKIRDQEVSRVVLVLPYWPGKPWFSIMQEMLIDIRKLPVFKTLVLDVVTGNPPPNIASCRLVVCLLSGRRDRQGCLKEPQNLLKQVGGSQQRHSTPVVGGSGQFGPPCTEYHRLRLL